jgi:hypothetical protein
VGLSLKVRVSVVDFDRVNESRYRVWLKVSLVNVVENRLGNPRAGDYFNPHARAFRAGRQVVYKAVLAFAETRRAVVALRTQADELYEQFFKQNAFGNYNDAFRLDQSCHCLLS